TDQHVPFVQLCDRFFHGVEYSRVCQHLTTIFYAHRHEVDNRFVPRKENSWQSSWFRHKHGKLSASPTVPQSSALRNHQITPDVDRNRASDNGLTGEIFTTFSGS